MKKKFKIVPDDSCVFWEEVETPLGYYLLFDEVMQACEDYEGGKCELYNFFQEKFGL